MTPYYQHEGISIYHAECSDLISNWNQFDLLLTDPPYGLGGICKGGTSGGWAKRTAQDVIRDRWDYEPTPKEILDLCRSICDNCVIWGGNYFELPLSRGWLVWNKPEREFSMSEAELAWTNRDAVIRVIDLPRSDYGRKHPTQKPLKLMSWCLALFPDAQTILDPFMGSGTTLLAAKQRGLIAVGIESEEEYCEMAALRLSQSVMDFE